MYDEEEKGLNTRKPIVVMLAIGVIISIALSLLPYSLTLISQKGQAITNAVRVIGPAAETSISEKSKGVAQPKAVMPTFNAAEWYAMRGEEPEKHGVIIESLDGRQVFAAHNADTTFNPASLVKLATSLVALRKLGVDYRFETRVFIDGEVDKAGALRGKLYVVSADPTFGDVAASLIARELRARGIKRVVDSIFVSPGFSFNYSESAEDSAKRLARVMRLGQKQTGVSEEPAGELLFNLSSYPLREILLYMNAHSNNFVADRIGAQIGGPGSVEQLLEDELKLPAEQITIGSTSGLDYNRMTPRDLLAVMRKLLEEAKVQGLKPEDILPIASCDVGTLRRRMVGTGLEGAVIGKTGTLTTTDGGMSNLAGFVYTKDYGTVLFAILAQGNRIWEHKQMTDQLLAEVLSMQALPCANPNDPRRRLLPSDSLRIEKAVGSGQKAESSRQ